MNKQFYAILFDNDPDFPGVLQWVTFMCGDGPNSVTDSYSNAKDTFANFCMYHPEINYKIVMLTMQELE